MEHSIYGHIDVVYKGHEASISDKNLDRNIP